MDKSFAKQFATKWEKSWNAHDINEIMEHYATDVILTITHKFFWTT
jgi:ketosteroid isomerase-like protein